MVFILFIYYSILNAYQIYQFEYEKLKENKRERIGENLIDFQIESLDKTIVRKIIEKLKNKKYNVKSHKSTRN